MHFLSFANVAWVPVQASEAGVFSLDPWTAAGLVLASLGGWALAAASGSVSASLLQGVLDTVGGPFVVLDLSGRLHRWNDAFASLGAVPAGTVPGESSGNRSGDGSDDGSALTLYDLCTGASRPAIDRFLAAATERAPDTPVPSVDVTLRASVADVPRHQNGDGSCAANGTAGRGVTLTGRRIDAGDTDFVATRLVDTAPDVGSASADLPPITECVGDVISRHAIDGTCLYASSSVESLLGFSADVIEGMTQRSLVHPDDADRVRNALQATQDGNVVRRRIRLQHKDGHYVWTEVTGSLRRDPETGLPVDVIASTRDVSDRVYAEQALQESELRFRQLAENVEGVFWLSNRASMLYVSPVFEDIWGRSRESLYAEKSTYLDGVHEADRPRIADAIDAAWTTTSEFNAEFRVVRPDGSQRWVRAMATPVTDTGGETRFAGYAVDITAYKEQEEALRQSEERWRRLVETHMEPIMISVDGHIRYVNPSGAQLFGADDPETIIGMSVLDFVHPAHLDAVRNRVDQLRAQQGTEPFEHRIQRLDGETRTVVSYSVPIRYDGEWAAQTVLRDVTEWRDAQSKLEYRIMLENLIVDLSTDLIDTSAKVTDARIEAALGQIGPFVGADRVYVFLLDADQGTMSNTHEWVDAKITPYQSTLQNLPQAEFPWLMQELASLEPVQIPDVDALPDAARREKQVFHDQSIQSLVLVPMTEGDTLVGFVGFDAVRTQRSWSSETVMLLRVIGDTFTNALARKETEQTLREREAQYRTVVENVRDIVFQTDLSGRWTFLNPAWEAMSGYDLDETLGRSMTAFLQGDGVDYAKERLFTGTVAEGTICRCEVKLRTRDGRTRWMAFFAQRTTSDGGESRCVVGTLHDVTERKRMEEQTREALQRERELNRLKASFASMVSHEFQTPLSTIRSSAEMLSQFFDTWSPEKRKKYVRRIHAQVDRMSRLVGDVITTSKLNAQQESPSLRPVDLRRFLRDVEEEVCSRYGPGACIDADVDVPDTVDADPDLLHHVLSNLLSNAVKYSPDGMRVTVRARLDEDALTLTVSDRGYGIPENDLDELFHPFFRGENKTRADGSGLGMTIVKRAVDVYGGTIDVDSTVGEGTTFTVRLPVRG